MTGKGLNKPRFFGRIAQGIAQLTDCYVQAMIEIHEGIIGPKFFSQLFPRDHLAWAFDQQRQHLTRLILQLDPLALFVEF